MRALKVLYSVGVMFSSMRALKVLCSVGVMSAV